MVINSVDMPILKESIELRKEYERRFGEKFIPFSYADFDYVGEKCPAQVWREELERCLRENHPTTMECHATEFFGH